MGRRGVRQRSLTITMLCVVQSSWASPSFSPTQLPSSLPTSLPSQLPSSLPSELPTTLPSANPSLSPSPSPTPSPSWIPTLAPTHTQQPTLTPTYPPSDAPTLTPTLRPTYYPTRSPTTRPTLPNGVRIDVSFSLYVLASSANAEPNTNQTEALKAQIANYTGIKSEQMIGFTVQRSTQSAPTPKPTPAPTPYPTHAPTQECGCALYKDRKAENITFQCDESDPTCETPSCLLESNFRPCCDRCGDNDDERRLLGQEEMETETKAMSKPGHRWERSLVGNFTAYLWEVSYFIQTTIEEWTPPKGSSAVTTPTELANEVLDLLRDVPLSVPDVDSIVTQETSLDGGGSVAALTRKPTPLPSTQFPTRSPTHPPSTTAQPTLIPTSSPNFAPTPLPTTFPTHAPTLFRIITSVNPLDPKSPFSNKIVIGSVPLAVAFIALLGMCCCHFRHAFAPFWRLFQPEDDGSLLMFSSFAGVELHGEEVDEQNVHQKRQGGVYTWAKQYHAKSIVQGTPTAQHLTGVLKKMELLQLQTFENDDSLNVIQEKKLSSVRHTNMPAKTTDIGNTDIEKGSITNIANNYSIETEKLIEFMKVIDEGKVINAHAPQMAQGNGEHLESAEVNVKLARLENIAVDMVRKQQELVNAVMVAEEKHRGLHNELLTLKTSQGKNAKMQAIGDATTTLGVGEHMGFVDKWLDKGALVDANVLPPPAAPTEKTDIDMLIPSERAARKKLKQQQKKQAKALEMKEKRRSVSSMRRRSLSIASVETNDKVERQSIGEISLTGDEIKSRQTGIQDDSIPAASDAGVLSSPKISNAPEQLKPTSLEGSNSESWFFPGGLL